MVLEFQRGPGPLEKGLGNKTPQTQPTGHPALPGIHIAALLPLGGDIWLAYPVHDLGGKARAVVGDRHGNVLLAPGGGHIHPLAGEIYGILNEITEAVENGRIPASDWFGRLPGAYRNSDRDAEVPVRRNHFLNESGQAHAVERMPAGKLGELAENRPAAPRLLVQETHVVGVLGTRLDRQLQLFGNQGDCCQRSSQFVGGGRCKAVELRKVLFARKHQLRGSERIRELTGVFGYLPGMQSNECNGQQN